MPRKRKDRDIDLEQIDLSTYERALLRDCIYADGKDFVAPLRMKKVAERLIARNFLSKGPTISRFADYRVVVHITQANLDAMRAETAPLQPA